MFVCGELSVIRFLDEALMQGLKQASNLKQSPEDDETGSVGQIPIQKESVHPINPLLTWS